MSHSAAAYVWNQADNPTRDVLTSRHQTHAQNPAVFHRKMFSWLIRTHRLHMARASHVTLPQRTGITSSASELHPKARVFWTHMTLNPRPSAVTMMDGNMMYPQLNGSGVCSLW